MIVVTVGHGKHALGATGSHTQYKCAIVSSDYESGFRSPGLDDDVDDLMCLAVYSSANRRLPKTKRKLLQTELAARPMPLPICCWLPQPMPLMSLYCNYASNPYGSCRRDIRWVIPPLATWGPSNFGGLCLEKFTLFCCTRTKQLVATTQTKTTTCHMFVVNKYRL